MGEVEQVEAMRRSLADVLQTLADRDDEPLEAMRRSLEDVLQTLEDRDDQLSRALKEQKRLNEELRRVRRQVNDINGKEADKMMDVAMQASTQALQMMGEAAAAPAEVPVTWANQSAVRLSLIRPAPIDTTANSPHLHTHPGCAVGAGGRRGRGGSRDNRVRVPRQRIAIAR